MLTLIDDNPDLCVLEALLRRASEGEFLIE